MSIEKQAETLSRTGNLLWLMKEYGVSFDLDGVKVATMHGAVKIFNNRWGIPYGSIKSTKDFVHYYSMTDWLKEINNRNPGVVKDPMQESIAIWNDDDNQRNSPAETGVLPLLMLMNNHEVQPHDITSRPAGTRDATEYWLKTKLSMFNDPAGRLHMQDGAGLNPTFKADRADELKVLFHFEDAGAHAEQTAQRGIVTGLVIQPWSESYQPIDPLIVRPTKYQGRPEVIRTFLSLSDFVAENPQLIQELTSARQK